MKTLTILARRWFQKSCGNTYHSSKIYVDGKQIKGVTFSYGYGEHYLTTALEKLQEQGFLKDASPTSSLYHYCENNAITLIESVTDVERKKDL